MGVLSLFHQLYSLDTLDTRFTTSATTPLKAASDESAKKTDSTNGKKQVDLSAGTLKSRWKSPEFWFYGLVVAFCIPQMYKAAWDVSQPSDPNWSKYSDLLSDGWLFGRKVDNSDGQYAGFRDNVPYLAVVLVLHPILRRATEYFTGTPNATKTSAEATARFKLRVTFDLLFALVFVSVLHGFSALKILIILYINFNIATILPRSYIPATTWIFNIATLFANELAHGYPFSDLATNMLPTLISAGDFGRRMDSYGGLLPRWEILFNFTVLRMISFNLDYCWSLDRDRAGSPVEVRQSSDAGTSSPISSHYSPSV
jgi:protein-cysteine N-palmitoyltransferase HHAT